MMSGKHLLSLRDALEDFHEGEYALKADVEFGIGTQTHTWQLLLNPPDLADQDGNLMMWVMLRRWEDHDVERDEGGEVASLEDTWHPNLLEFADAYGIDPDARIFELEWSVTPAAATIARASDPRWPVPESED